MCAVFQAHYTTHPLEVCMFQTRPQRCCVRRQTNAGRFAKTAATGEQLVNRKQDQNQAWHPGNAGARKNCAEKTTCRPIRQRWLNKVSQK